MLHLLHFEEAKQNYEDIWLQGDKIKTFIWGRLIEGLSVMVLEHIQVVMVGHKDLGWLRFIMVQTVTMNGLELLLQKP